MTLTELKPNSASRTRIVVPFSEDLPGDLLSGDRSTCRVPIDMERKIEPAAAFALEGRGQVHRFHTPFLQGGVEGWVSLSLQISGLFFLLFAVLAILSEYTIRQFLQNQRRARYIIAEERLSETLPCERLLNVYRDDYRAAVESNYRRGAKSAPS